MTEARNRCCRWVGIVVLLSIASLGKDTARAAQDIAPIPKNAPAISLLKFMGGFDHPIYLTHDGTDRIFIVEQIGRVGVVINGAARKQPYLDISKEVTWDGECGLLSIAFHPDFAKNGKVYAYYSNGRGRSLHSVISEFTTKDPKSMTLDPASERILLTVNKPWSNHNGGQLQFGPDGYLYTGTGDGGSGGDPGNRAQNGMELLGKMLRIDVDHPSDGKPYGIPADNPFVGKPGYCPEIWTIGMRNPWRFSFDRQTHDLWVGMVGQDKWEQIQLIIKGGNYGWRISEGTHPFDPIRAMPRIVPPIKEYPHTAARSEMPDANVSGNCIIGGYVYRGKKLPDLVGWYVYGDYSNSWLAGLKYEDGHVTGDTPLLDLRGMRISSFGEDKDGELYVCDHDHGNVYQIVAR